MKILKFLPGSIALAFGAAILTAPTASADPYCYSFGLFRRVLRFLHTTHQHLRLQSLYRFGSAEPWQSHKRSRQSFHHRQL